MGTQAIEESNLLTTVGQMVAEDYRKAEVFKKFNIDFCCGGNKSVEQVCLDKNVDFAELTAALNAIENKSLGNLTDFSKFPLDQLCLHIVSVHHQYVVEAITLLDEFTAKVASVHGSGSPEVIAIYNYYQAVRDELQMHMHKEEAILFPYIEHLVEVKQNGATYQAPPFGTIIHPIAMMEHEHDSAGNALAEIKRLSNNYTPPEHACNTFRVMYAKLEEFENDLHMHVHLENNILFPRAIALEQEITGFDHFARNN